MPYFKEPCKAIRGIEMGIEPFDPVEENLCWGCEFRKSDEADYINVCLLDDEKARTKHIQ